MLTSALTFLFVVGYYKGFCTFYLKTHSSYELRRDCRRVFSFYDDCSSGPSRRLNTMQWHFTNDDISRKASWCLRLYIFFLSSRIDWTVLRCKTHLFIFQQHWLTTNFCLWWKWIFEGRGSCVISSISYMYLKVRTTHFDVWPYIIWYMPLQISYWNPSCSNDECCMVTWQIMVMPPS